MMMNLPITLPGYQIADSIYEGTRTLVYKGRRIENQQPVIIKILRNPHPHFNELVGFRNQYVITRHLDSPYIVRPLALEPYGNGYALVMADEGAIALSDYWQTESPSLTQFLTIAIQLADALHYLNQQRIIHKDIKPANILIDPDTGQVQLIDFSISSLLPKEQQQLINPNVLEGTLAYISPEQTGRMNRGIDYRTDFYSLGVSFYKLLCGELPFTSQDPMELVHCHIAQTPTSLLSADIPQMVSELVMKLMAKNAEERYQSALGLKSDLERCLQSLETTGEIAEFELGERDICERFLIPEKLYGREDEVAQLLAAFNRVAEGKSEMMLVAGFSGIGKTAVINEVHKPIVKQQGYFIKGKFDQFNRNIPLSAFVQAFRDLMGQLLGESDADLAHWKSQILNALGENAQVILEVVPELERIIGKQPVAQELSGSAAQNRFNLLFQKFIAVFTTPEHPLVMFLDDLQWADSASLNLMKVLMSDSETGYLLLLGAYRDNEVFPTHPLILSLEELAKNKAVIFTITLDPLGEHHINQLVAQTLHCQEEIAQPLSELVYRKTQGNPFFTTQFLQGLHSDDYITFNGALGYWECDLVKVQDAALTNDVVEFMMGRLQNLPPVTQDILKLAACIGNQFVLETLGIISQQSSEEVASNLWRALQEGLVLPTSDTYKFFQKVSAQEQQSTSLSVGYRFLHDRVQQAAYTLIPEEQRKITHLNIGQLLLTQTAPQQREEKIFAIVNQLNMGQELIVSQPKRDELAQLNLSAGNKAKSATAHGAAWEYYTTGIGLLTPQCWQKQYEFTLALYLGATEAAYLSANFEEVERYGNIVLEQGVSILDKVKVYEIQIQVGMAKNESLQAVQIALKVLKSLGIELPESPTMGDIQAALQEVGMLCGGKSIEDFINLPQMSDPSKIAALQILSIVIPPSTVSAPALFPLIVAQQVMLSVKYGNAPLSAYAYVSYGFLLCAMPEGIELGYQFGQLALRMLEQSNSQELKAKILMISNGFIFEWKKHLKETCQPLLEAYKSGLESGDLEFAGYSVIHDGSNLFFIGSYLPELVKKVSVYTDFLSQIKLDPILVKNQLLQQLILNLVGEAKNPLFLKGEVYDEEKMLPIHQENKDGSTIFILYSCKLFLCYLFNTPKQGLEYTKKAEPYLDTMRATYWVALLYFYDSLACLAIDNETPERQLILERVTENQEKMKAWAHHAPMNFQHKYDLVEAEKHRVLDQKMTAMELYDQAIAGAKENEYIQEEALANELTAKFYRTWGKEKIAQTYMTDAYYGYARWGAQAKTAHLEAHYPDLLAPILQQQYRDFNPLDTLSRVTQTQTSTQPTQQKSTSVSDTTNFLSNLQAAKTLNSTNQTQSSSTRLSDTLDFASILATAQTLSSTIELDQLLGQIVQIILLNSGAKKTALLIPHPEQWQLQAMAQLTSDGTVDVLTQSQPLTADTSVPIRLVQYVKHTLEPVLIDEAKTDINGILPGYLLNHQPQSVFCLPLLNQGNLVAILYLEHPTTKGVFSRERQIVIQFLCTQAAISLQNAQLYDQSQEMLQELKQAQLQLVQSEKMSALGNLVAGVAHEINNPVGFIAGNLQPAQEYVRDLFGLIDLYQEKLPAPDEDLKEEIETIDLDFLREDLPKLIGSMQEGTERIRKISTSLRTFSRTDTATKTKCNLHEGIDSTLLILKYRLKANENRPAIEILKNYGKLPEVKCYAGQINQVFMNILANAIDAFEEDNQSKTYDEIEANPNLITIETSRLDENSVQIEITDNGCGMKPETKERIFEQGFTTKGVGKGTGLGMAIAHQIVEEKHGGILSCLSELGEGTTFILKIPLTA